MIKNSTFLGNFANEGGLVHSVEDYSSKMTMTDSILSNNYGDLNLFNGLDSNFQLFNTLLKNNTNTVFFLMRSTLFLNGVTITNQICSTKYKGCISNSVLTLINVNNLKLDTINTFLEDAAGFYLETSSGEFNNVYFNRLHSIKKIGNCFELQNSTLVVNFGSFQEFEQNCVNAKNSIVIINSTYFTNENAKSLSQTSFIFGTIYCESCLQFILNNSQFLNNLRCDYGGAVSLISKENDCNISAQFYNVSFVANQAFEMGGAVYLSNVHSSFKFCNFTKNKADKGAAIYFYSQGILSYSSINF